MSMAWVAVGTAALGAGVSLYGSNKQSKDQAHTNDANQAAVEAADRNAWNNYLMQRGIYGANAPTGTIPGLQPGQAVNSRLPLWANLRINSVPGAPAAGAPRPGGANVPFLIRKA